MSNRVPENVPASVVHGSMVVLPAKNSEDVSVAVQLHALKQVLCEVSLNQPTHQAEPSFQVTRETAQSLYDELFVMGFRFSGAEGRRKDTIKSEVEPAVEQSLPSSTKIRGINPECCGAWMVESSDEHA
jgi:hypothetical protein